MFPLALHMLFRDKGKCVGIIMGVMLASLVITQQGAIFVGLMTRTFGSISDLDYPDIWVMDEKVQFIDDTKPLQSTALSRVRGVPGVAWAVPLYKGMLRARLDNGEFQNCVIMGLDDATLTGGPPAMVSGRLEDLRGADAVIVDQAGASSRLARRNPDGSNRPLAVGDALELNDRRAVVVGICRNTRTFQNQPIVYTTYSRALGYAPPERKLMTFILVGAATGSDHERVCDAIYRATGLAAYTKSQFRWKTVDYFMKHTGIPINFGIAVSLGFIIGAVITGFMFYSFTVDNMRYFATLKAMGAADATLLHMILAQAASVGLIGFGMGAGLAAFFGYRMAGTELAFRLPWQLLVVSGSAVLIICVVSAMLSMWRVLALEPAIVFKG